MLPLEPSSNACKEYALVLELRACSYSVCLLEIEQAKYQQEYNDNAYRRIVSIEH
jgi:hypothetical protein